jgi:hypothetical protein
MLDDASEQGLAEALRLLPVSCAGSGLLVTSQKIKKEDDFRRILASRSDGAAAKVTVCSCGILDHASALQLFDVCGFKFEPEDSDFRSDVASELQVQPPRLQAAHARVSHCCCSGHGVSSCRRAAVRGVEQPPHGQGRREA